MAGKGKISKIDNNYINILETANLKNELHTYTT